jgi:7-carboxy-7-deazaguanine synthase
LIYISEIFGPTIQGEGLRNGKVSVFIRFANCNLNCRGFGVPYEIENQKRFGCDSFHSVDNSFISSWEKIEDSQTIINRLNEIINNLDYKPDIVITGGEPLINWNNFIFQEFINYYLNKDFELTIETNGSVDIEFFNTKQKNILFSISPKLSNSNEKIEKRINYKALENFLNLKNSYLKFVPTSQKDFDEILDITKKLNNTKDKVFIMPQGFNELQIRQNCQKSIDFCIKYGFRYTDRLHIRVWNNKKGV